MVYPSDSKWKETPVLGAAEHKRSAALASGGSHLHSYLCSIEIITLRQDPPSYLYSLVIAQ